MSAQPVRQLTDQVYQNMHLGNRAPMTKEDWAIIINSSFTCRKALAFSVVEDTANDNDALLMIDLTIESACH